MRADQESRFIPIRKGDLVEVSKGQYSDYAVIGFFRALADIDIETSLESYLDTHPDQRVDYTFDENAFLASLTSAGLLEETLLPRKVLHLGDYGQVSTIEMSEYAPAKE